MRTHIRRSFLSFFSLMLPLVFSAGCVSLSPQEPSVSPPGQERPAAGAGREQPPPTGAESGPEGQNIPGMHGLDIEKILNSERNRDQCFHLQPGPVTTKKKGHGHRTVGRCQPQSLIYARCRTGMATCKLGDTSPVQWFACAKRNGNTTTVPTAGSVMVLDVNSKRRMSTGHPVYVEQVTANGNGTWLLRISHTNYDRKCHLDLDAKVLFDPLQMTATFKTGPWACWACDLKVLGFILR